MVGILPHFVWSELKLLSSNLMQQCVTVGFSNFIYIYGALLKLNGGSEIPMPAPHTKAEVFSLLLDGLGQKGKNDLSPALPSSLPSGLDTLPL